MSRSLFNRRLRSLGIRAVCFRTEGDPPPAGGGGGPAAKPERSVSQVVGSLIQRHGSAETALGVLAGENRDYRRRHQADQQAIAALQGKAPAAGSVVLSPEEAKKWEAYKALGEPDAVRATVEKVGTLETTLAEKARGELIAEAAGLVAPGQQWKPSVLQDIVQVKGLHVEMRDTTEKDAKGVDTTVKRPHVRLANDEKAPLVPLAKWVADNAADYLPALTAAGAGAGTSGTPGGVAFHSTTRTAQGATTGTDLVSQRLARNAEKAKEPSPYDPAKVAATK
jgi:hypothetical protein